MTDIAIHITADGMRPDWARRRASGPAAVPALTSSVRRVNGGR